MDGSAKKDRHSMKIDSFIHSLECEWWRHVCIGCEGQIMKIHHSIDMLRIDLLIYGLSGCAGHQKRK
jgi:hypothetical protein